MSRCECVYKRTGEPSVPFCEKGGTVQQVTDFFAKKIGTSVTCSDVEAPPRFELGNKAFAELCLTSWLWRRIIKFEDKRRNPRPLSFVERKTRFELATFTLAR